MKSAMLVRAVRAPITESVHRGHMAVVNTAGKLLASAGDPGYRTFARSAAKPLQAVPVIEAGAAERYSFDGGQIALMCASHNGEPEHLQAALELLAKLGLTEAALQCGPHYPYYEPAAERMKRAGEQPTRLHNNCSGKHAGMLALALLLNASTDDYMSPAHPVQQTMLRTVSEFSGVPSEDIALGTDGCGVPVFGLPLDRLAYAFASWGAPDRLSTPTAEACRKIIRAVRSHPHFIAGTDRFDTRLIEATGGRLVGKMGAEGVFAVANPERKAALAVKIEDGAQRALYPAVTEALVQLGWLTLDETEALRTFHRPPVRNFRGAIVGELVPDFALR
ncbi:asparaginase [Paenibacillus sp. GCM10012303]|uniref:asparaginase n=1 Tax=Paenibacillus sp. GCM10012303 TaxID=3317340 RepID=UPI0036201863